MDHTLEVSSGPITFASLLDLAAQGECLGLCGNFAAVTLRFPQWYRLFSFLGSFGLSKAEFLKQIKQYVLADDYIMVGNIIGVSGQSDDSGAAQEAGWRFIQEKDFAQGVR